MQDCSCRPERERHIGSLQQMPQSATQAAQWTFVTALRPLHALIAAPSFIYLTALTVMLFRPPDLQFYHLDRIAFLVLILAVTLYLLGYGDDPEEAKQRWTIAARLMQAAIQQISAANAK